MNVLPVNPIATTTAPQADDVSTALRLDLQTLLKDAIAESGWKQTALAATLKKDPGQLNRELNGTGREVLTLDDVEVWPREILVHFALQILKHCGFEDAIYQMLRDLIEYAAGLSLRVSAVMAFLNCRIGMKRMAKASMPRAAALRRRA